MQTCRKEDRVAARGCAAVISVATIVATTNKTNTRICTAAAAAAASSSRGEKVVAAPPPAGLLRWPPPLSILSASTAIPIDGVDLEVRLHDAGDGDVSAALHCTRAYEAGDLVLLESTECVGQRSSPTGTVLRLLDMLHAATEWPDTALPRAATKREYSRGAVAEADRVCRKRPEIPRERVQSLLAKIQRNAFTVAARPSTAPVTKRSKRECGQ
jgi:hypothetical protein